MDLDALATLLARLHDRRWTCEGESVRLMQAGDITWMVLGRVQGDGLQVVAQWAPSERESGAHEIRMHLVGTPIEIVQQIMARLPIMQRNVQLAFEEGVRQARATEAAG